MAIETAIQTALQADGTLVAAATGGIYTYTELRRQGITRSNAALSAAFTSGFLKPLIVVKVRDILPQMQIIDPARLLRGATQAVEIWFYDDGDNGYSTLETMRQRVYTLLEAQRLDNAKIHWRRDQINERDFALDNACFEMSEYDTTRVRTT